MTAVCIRAMNDMRARWRAWLAIALMVGISGGVAIFFGTRRGARPSPAVPSLFIVLGVPGALILANLIAAVPARAAARAEPALVLRTG